MTTQHVYPLRDLRDHITNGGPCPCMATTVDGVTIHNSYDGREVGEVCRRALDTMAMLLTCHDHELTAAERRLYEHAINLLDMHWPVRGVRR